ncbi:peptide chain release factor 2 [SAR202 cluster bacterium AD-802-E10_MRT_200m]|nr:peptide chain release factor 2 [SAR202 cluster bacterium AD-802-E10_MRT_200m]MQF82585.1 peptide chain release factor 2 [SAR202 cluster bacterium AD-802-E10_MRT_200m]
MFELKDKIDEITRRINFLMERLDIPKKVNEAEGLEKQSAVPDFWKDSRSAQNHMRRLTGLREEINTWTKLERDTLSLGELIHLSIQEGDEGLNSILTADIENLEVQLDQLEFNLLLSGPYDQRDAILAVHCGAGGVDSQDWAQMLLRMYLRWAEKQGFEAKILDTSQGEEAGIKSATVEIKGRYAHGWLKSEKGVHRLVRLSPYDASHMRHTSFALVELWPEADGDPEIAFNEQELRIDHFRASGHGGQNVQKVETAVRIVHEPSGITVTCQNERSQSQNKEAALKILWARVLNLEMQKRAAEQARLKGEHVTAGWGNQIRSYTLHPYKLVKDHRSGYESHDPLLVLDGELDSLLRAYLLNTVGKDVLQNQT